MLIYIELKVLVLGQDRDKVGYLTSSYCWFRDTGGRDSLTWEYSLISRTDSSLKKWRTDLSLAHAVSPCHRLPSSPRSQQGVASTARQGPRASRLHSPVAWRQMGTGPLWCFFFLFFVDSLVRRGAPASALCALPSADAWCSFSCWRLISSPNIAGGRQLPCLSRWPCRAHSGPHAQGEDKA